MKTSWNRAEDRLLLQMVAMKLPAPEVAARFGCSVDDIANRVKELATPPPPPTPVEDREETVLDPVQTAFLSLAQHYNQTGESLKTFAELISRNLSEVELAAVLQECNARATRLPGEPLYMAQARELFKRCIVIPRPDSIQVPIGNAVPNNTDKN